MVEKDGAQPGVDSPTGNSKNPRPRARPLNRAKTKTQVISSSPQLQGQTQPPASGAATAGIVESARASSPTQGVENEDSEEDTPRLSRKRPSPTSHQLNRARKRQKILDQVQSKVPETMNRSADVNAAAEGNYIPMVFQTFANEAC
jgi:hypothetical protein